MAALPFGAFRRQLDGKAGRSGAGAVHGCRVVARRKVDVLLRQYRQRDPHLAAALSGWNAGAGHLRRVTEERHSFRARRPLVRHVDRHEPEHGVVSRLARRSSDHVRGLRLSPSISPDGKKLYYLVRAGGTGKLHRRRALGGGPGIRTAPAAASRFSDAALLDLRGRPACGVCRVRRKRPTRRCGWRL